MSKFNDLTPDEQALAKQLGDQLRKELNEAFIGTSSTESTINAVKSYVRSFMMRESLANPDLNLAEPKVTINGPEMTISWE
jgi:hypothetical protein